MQVSVVIPVHNEAGNIIPLIEETIAVLKQAKVYEIIVVDDGSQDDTCQVLKQALKKFKPLRVIQHQHGYGQSTAIRTGVSAARYPVVATLDGDGQNDPADIPRLYDFFTQENKINKQLWMVAGWRNKRHDSAWKLFSSKFANTVRAGLLGDKTPDTGCGLKIFLRDKFLDLPYFDHMHRFLPALIIRAGGQVVSQPVNHRARAQGVSNYGTLDRLWAGITDLAGVLWLKRRAKLPKTEEIQRGT